MGSPSNKETSAITPTLFLILVINHKEEEKEKGWESSEKERKGRRENIQ